MDFCFCFIVLAFVEDYATRYRVKMAQNQKGSVQKGPTFKIDQKGPIVITRKAHIVKYEAKKRQLHYRQQLDKS